MSASNYTTIHEPEAFLRWLGGSTWTLSDVINLCRIGFDSSRDSQEPHIQLVSALPLGGDRYPLVKRLAERVGKLLTEYPTLEFPYPGASKTPTDLQYDVLSLASLLDCPDELATPLQECEKVLRASGAQLVPSVRGALLEALTRRQRANSPLKPILLDLAGGKADSLFGRNPEMGIQGLSLIPSADQVKHPGVDRDPIGEGLLHYAAVCAPDVKTRRQRFRRTVKRIQKVWDLKSPAFVMLADKFQWVQKGHGWAVEALPELFCECFGEVGNYGKDCWLVWKWFVDKLRPLQEIEEKGSLCDGQVLIVHFGKEHSTLCSEAHDRFQRLAKGGSHELSEFEAKLYVEQEAGRIERAAERIKQSEENDNVSSPTQLATAQLNEASLHC